MNQFIVKPLNEFICRLNLPRHADLILRHTTIPAPPLFGGVDLGEGRESGSFLPLLRYTVRVGI